MLNDKIESMKKIIAALDQSRYSEAGIRIAQAGLCEYFDVVSMDRVKKVYDPEEQRDAKGRWTSGESKSEPKRIVVVDPYCKLVKELCIVEATSELPTRDFGASFQKTYNACMDRHGCLGRA